MYKKLKSLLADDLVFTSLLLCCVAMAAFVLGRASVVDSVAVSQGNGPTVRQTALLPLPTASTTPASVVRGESGTTVVPPPTGSEPIVASKSGTKYHLATCPGAKQIKSENKVYFESAADAAAAGYTPAANCQF